MSTPRPLTPNLTPMIDVVFLLLLFFILSTQFGSQQATPIEIAQSSAGSGSSESPYLIEFGAELRLNGKSSTINEILGTIQSDPRLVAIRPDKNISVQELLVFQDALRQSGADKIVLVEGEN